MNGFYDDFNGNGTTWSTSALLGHWCGNGCKYSHIELKNGKLYRVFCNKKMEWIREEAVGEKKLFDYIKNDCKDYEEMVE